MFHHDLLIPALMENCLMPRTYFPIYFTPLRPFQGDHHFTQELIYPTTSWESQLVMSSRYLEKAVSPTKSADDLCEGFEKPFPVLHDPTTALDPGSDPT